jgi:hypothetical protein
MSEPDQYLQQITLYTAQSINWLKQCYGGALSADQALECATRMAMSAALLRAASEINAKVDEPEQDTVEANQTPHD